MEYPRGQCSGQPCLSSLLILKDIYLQDYPVLLSKFADDTKVGMPVNNETDSIVLQNVINTLFDWSDDLSM